jgi:hypothetical protein
MVNKKEYTNVDKKHRKNGRERCTGEKKRGVVAILSHCADISSDSGLHGARVAMILTAAGKGCKTGLVRSFVSLGGTA